jgi:hypothetical protein
MNTIIKAIDNNEERKINHSGEHKILTWKTLSNKERLKPRASASKNSLYQKSLQMPWVIL